MANVELKGLRKVYPGDIVAVNDVSLQVGDGEFVVLVGPSGCGKSTTLRMIAGLEEITGGDVFIGDTRVNDVHPKDRDIAMVFQNYALYPHMTVYKNMAFGLTLRKLPKAEIQERVMNAAKILGIEDLLQRKPKALSGGQRQRAAVGRALVRDPKVFLFDEPLSNLDALLRTQMRAELSKLHTRLKTTMIYVTHDQVEAMTMGDRIVVMLDGEVQQVATPSELYARPVNRFVAGFIGSPPMNFLEGTLGADNGFLQFRGAGESLDLEVHADHHPALGAYSGKPVVIGIRPEDFCESTGQTTSSGTSIVARVDVVEPLGAETYLYLDVAGQTVTARVQTDRVPEVNESRVLDVAMEKAHYFDPESGVALAEAVE